MSQNITDLFTTILNSHPDIKIINKYYKCVLDNCNYKNKQKDRLILHIIKNHTNNNTVNYILNKINLKQFYSSSLSNILTQEIQNTEINEDEYGNILQYNLQKQKKDNRSYDEIYVLNFIKNTISLGLPLYKIEQCSKSLQNVYFGKEILDIPCDTTLDRFIKAIDNTLNFILLDLFKNYNYNIIRSLDESSGYLILIYYYPIKLNTEQINEYKNNLNLLQNIPENKLSIEDKKEIKKLERNIKFKYKLDYFYSGVFSLLNLTTNEILKHINLIETTLNLKPNTTICDNRNNVLSFVKQNNTYLLNCMRYNLNLLYKHFIESLYKNFESEISKIIRKLRSHWKFLQLLISIDIFDNIFIENYLCTDEEIPIISNDLPNINKPITSCLIRWQSLAIVGDYIYKYYKQIYKALLYWNVDTRLENIQSIFTDIINILKNENFYEFLQINNYFYNNFLSKCYINLRKNIREEKKRKKERQRIINNIDQIEAIILLFKAYNVLQNNNETIDINLENEISFKNLRNILNFLIKNNYLIDNNNYNVRSFTDICDLFNNELILNAVVDFTKNKIIPNINKFNRPSQTDIRDSGNMLGIDCNSESENSLNSFISDNLNLLEIPGGRNICSERGVIRRRIDGSQDV
ncbi:hypothetical protein ABK040_004404 [Willaertia magna]